MIMKKDAATLRNGIQQLYKLFIKWNKQTQILDILGSCKIV